MSFQIVNREIFYQFWIKNNCKKEDFNKKNPIFKIDRENKQR